MKYGFLSVLCAGALLTQTVKAQEFAYCDLSVPAETSNLQLNGATVVTAGTRKTQGIEVTSETANQRSTVYHSVPITFAPGSSLYQHFRVRISGGGADTPPAGADGFAFMIQNDPGGDPLGEGKTGAGLTAIGRNGEGFGYAGITQSFALELDTFLNASREDPDGNHIGLDFGGENHHTTTGLATGTTLAALAEGATAARYQPVSLNLLHSLESTTASFDTRDVWIDYVCASGTCTTKVYMTFNNSLLAAGFADPTVPATLPAKPATPILVTNGLSDLETYLNGATGYAGFSASTGGSKDEHLVTYWVLSQTAFADKNGNDLEDVCDCKNVPGACGGNIPICDLTAAQGFCRNCLSNAECKTADPTKPVCDAVATGGSGACVACLSNTDCAAATPNCNTTTNVCTASCSVDAECPKADWCNNPTGGVLTGTCTGKLANGATVPTSAKHTPVLNGVCTAAAGAAVCASGVCDTADNKCGIAVGDGTCTVVAECRAGQCVTAGTNAGKCEPCATDKDCSGGTPACNTATNTCVQCTTTNGTACKGDDPICSTATHACVACNGNAGSAATAACPASTKYCDVTTGSCSANCTTDAECGAGNWCNNVTLAGVCAPKVANGSPVPGGTCTVVLGGRACVATVCDTKDDRCGIAAGDGTCTVVAECRTGVCVVAGSNKGKCDPCADDGDCAGTSPACDTATNQCAVCTATNSTKCAGNTPICSGNSCTGCTSDLGVPSAHPCTTAGTSYCASGGACGQCSTSSDCIGPTHAGAFCVSGSCTSSCVVDSDCGASRWCDAGTCEAKLPNGSPLPTPPPIGGVCTPTTGERVCVSGVCSAADEECGLPNGGEPVTDAGSPTECRSGVVGRDGKCGYPNGQGPCTASDGSVVCRTGECDNVTGLCGSSDGGVLSHTDGGLSCPGGAIGTDGKCGYPNGQGPCTADNGATVCRSGECNAVTSLCGASDAGTVIAQDSGTMVSHQDAGQSISHRDAGSSCPSGTCQCSTDSDCGSASSGVICNDSRSCQSGCRGAGAGNSCPSGASCSSTTAAIGTCSTAAPTGILEGGGCACAVVGGRSQDGTRNLAGLALLAGVVAVRRRRGQGGRPRRASKT